MLQVEVQRIQTQIDQMSGVPGLGSKLVQYIGGVSNYYVNVSYPASIFNSVTKQQGARGRGGVAGWGRGALRARARRRRKGVPPQARALWQGAGRSRPSCRVQPCRLPADGRAMYSLINMTTTCYDSSPLVANSEPPPADDGGGGGTPSWVWAVVGSVLGCAALALVAAAFLWRRKRRLQAQLEAAGGSVADEEGRCSKNGSNAELASLGSGLDKNTSSLKALSGQVSSELSGQMPSQFLRTRWARAPAHGQAVMGMAGMAAGAHACRAAPSSEPPVPPPRLAAGSGPSTASSWGSCSAAAPLVRPPAPAPPPMHAMHARRLREPIPVPLSTAQRRRAPL